MFRNMAVSLIEHEIIKTTVPKAKELRRVAEPLITLAKQDTVANRRLAFSRVRSQAAVGKLFSELGPRYKDRPGGYTRILKSGFRPGDAAPVAYVELVERAIDFEDYDDDYDDEDVDQILETESDEIEDAEIVDAADEDAEAEKVRAAAASDDSVAAEDTAEEDQPSQDDDADTDEKKA